MKFQNAFAFEKHLSQAAKVHLSRIFLVVSSCPYERKKIIEKVIAAVKAKHSDLSVHAEDAQQGALEEKIDELNTSSLFSGQQLLCLDGIDKLKKNGLALLADYAARPSPFAYLALGAASGKGLDDFYDKGKKELVVCDLSTEKPWDRKDRLKQYLIEKVAKAGKRMSGEAIEALLDSVGASMPHLEQEADKLITYAGERQTIALSDVTALCAAQKSETLWQLAEAIVWKDSPPKAGESADLSLLIPLISQVRAQLQNGLTIAVLLERGAAHHEIAHYLPTLKPAALDRILPIAKGRKSPFFRRALDVMFDIELMAKNSSLEPGLIFDLITVKLQMLKHALLASQPAR